MPDFRRPMWRRVTGLSGLDVHGRLDLGRGSDLQSAFLRRTEWVFGVLRHSGPAAWLRLADAGSLVPD
jgi:hypothetical protein